MLTARVGLLATLIAVALRPAAGAAESPLPPSRSRLGINLAGCADWNTEHPFVDVFRLSRRWISQREGAPWGRGPELERDAHGWIKRLEPGCWAETPVLTAGHAPVGQYVCLYEGDGDLEFVHNARVVSRAPGRIVVELDGAKGGVFIQLRRTNPENPVRNIRLLMPGHERDFAAEPFNPAFLNRWRGFNTLRFMDWMETNGSQQREWQDRPTTNHCNFTERGVPLEVMVELCNRLGANPWFCMPHLASDDYVRRFAAAVKQLLRPDLVVYVEYSNEIWNSMFAQTRHAGEQGRKLGFGEKDWEAGWRYSAWRSMQIHKIWEEVFGGRERLVRVIASQAANPYVSEQKLQFREAWKQFDALAIAPYFSLNVPAKGEDRRPGADQIASWPLERLLDYVATNSIPEAIRHMREQKAVADRYGLRLICYEAGQHLVGVGGAENNDALTQLLQAANRHPRMGDFYRAYLDGWKNVGGGDLCCIFSSVGQYSKWGSWGLLEYADQTGSAKFDAVTRWNRENPR
jgi:hypothetical protein